MKIVSHIVILISNIRLGLLDLIVYIWSIPSEHWTHTKVYGPIFRYAVSL